MRTVKSPYRVATARLKRTFLLVGVFSAIVNILMLTGPMFMLQVYDRVLSSGSIATLQGLFIIVVVCYGFLGLYDFLRTRLLSRAAYRLDQDVGKYAFDAWVRSGLSNDLGTQRPLVDLSVLRGFLASPAMLGFFDLPWIPLYLAVVFFVHPWLGWLALAGAIVVVVAALLNQWATHRHFARAMGMDGAEAAFVEQSHRTGEALVPLGMLQKVRSHWQSMHARSLATGQVGGDRAEGFAAFSKSFRLLLQSSLLGLGGYLALQQEISAGMIVAASIIAGRALAPIDQVIGQWRNVVRSREAHRRLGEALSGSAAPEKRTSLPDPKGHLDVSGVTKFPPGLGHRGDVPPMLQNLSFSLEPGDGLGVIGPSASGKTTLARILVGAWQPDAGEVRLDGATLSQWEPDQLGRFIGYLPQSMELLAGTIRDNICRFSPDAEDAAIVQAAQMAGVHEMILQLADGYETRLDYGVPPLSGGQMQRVGLARAVYGLPKLVILDEPNANLDATGDEALASAIAGLREAGSVVIVMAHRPSAIAAVNKLMVLNSGKVADFGEKAEVLRRATRPTSGQSQTAQSKEQSIDRTG
ncbi:MAG: type I secretion system permease/ATPase [Paracoccaceae bacterium]|nr:type I secretion system permease/ATPase [Paracoccaceae bacterium]